MDQDTIIKVDHVSMKFNLSSEKVDNFKEYLIKRIKNNMKFYEFNALTDDDFEVNWLWKKYTVKGNSRCIEADERICLSWRDNCSYD